MTIALILASQSHARQKVLADAGVRPTISVSHVDEVATLAQAARAAGMGVRDFPIEHQVGILAQAKAQHVYEAYRQVAKVVKNATGESIVSYPLRAPGVQGIDVVGACEFQTEDDTSIHEQDLGRLGRKKRLAVLQSMTTTRDFSQFDAPVEAQSLAQLLADQPGFVTSRQGPLILGCDSMFLFQGQVFGKPHTPEMARQRLKAMRGGSGELWTGHCLIDFATGKQVQGADHARMRFGQYSDQEIEAYISTGEPLEVAGAFTLEGYGSAFIEGMDGDPHTVMGVSIYQLRALAKQLGVVWTDLWNVTFANARSTMDTDGAAASASHPSKSVLQPGDGWVDCACGKRHWGLNGASGVLIVRRATKNGEPMQIALQHRALWSAEGGTWSIPGGATADGENAVEGALRESYEEANVRAEDVEVVGSYREDHGTWAYTTVFAFEKAGHHIELRANDDESMSVEWVSINQVPDRNLLTALRTDWPRFRRLIEDLAGAVTVG